MRTRWVRRVLLAAAAVLAAGCAEGEVAPLPPAPVVAGTSTTVPVDFSGIGLRGVPGRTTTTVALQPGDSTISGTVVGPNGPVAQAVVRAERIVGDASGSVDIVSGVDGSFAFTTMVGGRYRLRAWKPAPDNLSMTTPEVFFLAAKESKVLTLTVRPFTGVSVSSDVAPNPPVVGAPANLVVQVVDQQVDPQGVVRGLPVTGARVELFGAGDWRLRSTNPQATDPDGRVSFTLTCQRAGSQPLSVVVGDTLTFPLELPACAVPTEPEPPTSTPAAGAATTTTSR